MSVMGQKRNGFTPASRPFFPSKQTRVSEGGTSAWCHKQTLLGVKTTRSLALHLLLVASQQKTSKAD
jgi:hypothetical protein